MSQSEKTKRFPPLCKIDGNGLRAKSTGAVCRDLQVAAGYFADVSARMTPLSFTRTKKNNIEPGSLEMILTTFS